MRIETGHYPTYYLNLSISDTEQRQILGLAENADFTFPAVIVIRLQDIRKIESTFDEPIAFLGNGEVV